MGVRILEILSEERGVTSIEYALIATLIALVIIGAVTGLGTRVEEIFFRVGTSFPR